MLTIIVEQRFLRLPSVSCAKDRIRFLINFRALRAVFQRNKATLNYHLLRQYFIWHRLLRVFLTRSSTFSLAESMIAFKLIGSAIIRCTPAKDDSRTLSIISWCVLEPCWRGKSEYESLAPGKVSSVWAPDISCLTPAHGYFKTLTLISRYCQQYCKNNTTETK